MSLYIFYDFDSDAMFPRHFPSISLSACFFFFCVRGEGATLNLPFIPSETFQKKTFPLFILPIMSACQGMVKMENT